MSKKKKVFICSPFAPNGVRSIGDNIVYAKAAMKDSISRGEAPFVPHLLYPQVLSEETEREVGLTCGLAFLEACDIIAVYEDFGVSAGMTREIAYATRNSRAVIHRRRIEP